MKRTVSSVLTWLLSNTIGIGAGARGYSKLLPRAGTHLLPQPCLRIVAPVFGVELKKYRSIGESHRRLENHDVESLSHLVDFRDNLLVRQRCYLVARERCLDSFSIRRHSGSVLLGHERKLGIHVNHWPHMNRVVDRAQHCGYDLQLVAVRFQSLHSSGALQRVRRVDNDDPVTMTKQWQYSPQPCLPLPRIRIRSETDACHCQQHCE